MKKLGLLALLLSTAFLFRTVFAYPTLNNFVTVFHGVDSVTFKGDHSGYVITNFGATGSQTLNLPPAKLGMYFIFAVSAAHTIDINPQDGDQILNLTSHAGDKIRSDTTIGTTVELVAIHTGKWLPIRKHGTWTDED